MTEAIIQVRVETVLSGLPMAQVTLPDTALTNPKRWALQFVRSVKGHQDGQA